MKMTFGKYENKPVAWVLLTDPGYFYWMREKQMKNYKEYKFAIELIKVLDSLPYKNVKCMGECGGENPVTRFTLYKNKFNGEYWFCDSCDPYSKGAISGNLHSISEFSTVFGHKDQEYIIKAIVSAKGAPKIKTEKALANFFGY